MKRYKLSKMDKYNVRHETLLKSFNHSNSIKLRTFGFSSEVQVSVKLLLKLNFNISRKIPLIKVWSCWQPGETRVNAENRRIVDVSELKLIKPKGLKISFKYDKGTIFFADFSRFTKNRKLIVSFVFTTVRLLYRLKEAEPYNRFILSFSCQLPRYVVNRTRLMIKRPKKAVTRFTKGNFILAAPALESEESLLTAIYYDSNLIFLQYGFGNAEIDFEMAPWTFLLVGGSGILIALSFLFGAKLSQMGTIEIPGSLITLTLTMFEIIRRYLSMSRHKIYTGKKSYVEINLTLVIVGLTAVILLIIVKSFIPEISSYVPYFSLALLIYDCALIIASLGGIAGLRVGAWQRYECDMPFCNKILYFRTRSKECIATGRVFCNLCFLSICKNCACMECEKFNCDTCTQQNKYMCLLKFHEIQCDM